MSASAASVITWKAPGPGLWERDAAHQERPFSTLWLEAAPPGFRLGFGEAFARFGLPFSGKGRCALHLNYNTYLNLAGKEEPPRPPPRR